MRGVVCNDQSSDGTLPSFQNEPGSWARRLDTLPRFAVHRARRLGVGSLVKVAGTILVLFLLAQVMKPHFRDQYRNIVSWTLTERPDDHGLRIVVFGSQDVAGSSEDSAIQRETWQERLCKELKCGSLLSFVPSGDSQPGIMSNGIYSDALLSLEQGAKDANIIENPAADLFFVSEQYPVPAQTPDLERQIQQFLALPPQAVSPRETLWIFTFGTWDIWNLAALPLETGEKLVDASTSHLFHQIEYLLKESLVPESIAFSDFWRNATQATVDELTVEGAAESVDARKFESFRVIVPQLFDVSLTPGWRARQEPSPPHSKADQLRNSAVLTARWNENIQREMRSWMAKGSTRPAGVGDDQVGTKPLVPEGEEDDATVYAPFPRRLGFSADIAGGIRDAMTEEEMHRIGATDSVGRGSVPAKDEARFRDVWNPCVQGTSGCEKPADHLFYDSFTLSQRAINLIAKKAAKGVFENLILEVK